MRFLRQNTAVRITVGPFLDKTDGITPETGLTATNEHITFMVDDDDNTAANLIIDANATASGGNNDLVHVTNDDAGFYDLELTAAQTNYLGRAMLSINYVTDHCPVFHEFMIIPQQVYDSLFGTDKLQVDSVEISSDSGAADNLEAACDGNTYNVGGGAVVAASVTAAVALAASQPNYAPAKAGDAMALVNDAITSGKFDESTAYPLKSADTGATAVARTGADADTLETISDQIDGVASPGDKMDIVDAPSSTGLTAIADAVLKRDWSSITGEPARCMLNAMRALRNKFVAATGAAGYKVKKEDDSTDAWTGVLTVDENGVITAMDPD